MFPLRWIHSLLLLLPPETAHRLAVWGLRGLQWWRFRGRRGLSHAPALKLRTPGVALRFAGRVGLAAGFDKSAEVFAALSTLGFGFVEVGTVTPLPQRGNPKPRIWRHPGDALVNHLGFNNCGLEAFRAHLLRYRAVVSLPVLANIGKNKVTPNENAIDDYRKGFDALAALVDGFVVNLSSPNTPGLFQLQSIGFLDGIARLVPPGKPTWIKLSPDLPDGDLRELCALVRGEPRFAGVVVTNTSRTLAEKLVGAPVGGLSGRPLHERSVQCVALAREALGSEKTLIGVGGICDAGGAMRMRAAGADLIEVYTGFIYRGIPLLRELDEALREDKPLTENCS